MLTTTKPGFHQSDIIIRTALIEGLKRVKEQPWLLDFVFSSLVQDDYAISEYGEKELDKIKQWFMDTNIPVTMSFNREQPQTPLIAISLEDSTEAESTLADVSKEGPDEDVDFSTVLTVPQVVAGPFTPLSFSTSTSTLVLPDTVDLSNVYPGMAIVDRERKNFYVIEGLYEQTIVLEGEDIDADFTGAVIAPQESIKRVTLESCEFKEVYRIDTYVSGNPVILLFLHTLIIFILMRYKQELLEARGFERSTISSKGITGFPNPNGPEFIYDRVVMVNGFVQHFWPKDITGKISAVATEVSVDTTISEDTQSVGPQ